jgi:very-short-patch-repair endonuclease
LVECLSAHWEHLPLDGHETHRTRAAFERDRKRDTTLQLAGYRVLRITHRRLKSEPAQVVAAVRALLDRV